MGTVCYVVPTWMFVSHSECVAVKGDTPAPPLSVGRVDTEEQGLARREAPRQQLGAPRSDVDQQLVLRQGKHFHVELLTQARAEAFNTIYLQ